MNCASGFRVFICIAAILSCRPNAKAVSATPSDHWTALDPDLKHFVTEKRELANELSQNLQVQVPPIVWHFFDAAEKGDWQTTSNDYYRIEGGAGRQGGRAWFPRAIWGPIHDTFGADEQFHLWNDRLLHRYGATLMRTIPDGSIYFGGTDPGRFVISALSASQNEGRPFFTLTQNTLADATYLDYLRDMYGEKIYVPTRDDLEHAFNAYLADAEARSKKHQLMPGEAFNIVNGRAQVSGLVAVMSINERLAKLIVEKNPSRAIYLEQSYAMEGLYGQSLPHGLIFKVEHHPLSQVPRPVMEANDQFWTAQCRALIGSAVTEHTSVAGLCSWIKRVFLQPESGAFKGNPAYLKDTAAALCYAHCRTAVAGYYRWWSKKSDKSEAARLTREADLAYRQSVALCPYNPGLVWNYANFLLQNQRTNDARVLIETTLNIDPGAHMNIQSVPFQRAMEKLRAEAKKLSNHKPKE